MNNLPDLFRRNRSLLSDFFRDLEQAIGSTAAPFQSLSSDIRETDDAFVVSMDVPGFKPQDLKVDLSGNVLTVVGEHSEKHGAESKQMVERRYGSLQRSILLPSAVDADAISAHCEDGVLEIMIPKHAESGRRSIDIHPGRLELGPATKDVASEAKGKTKSGAAKH